MYNQLIMTKKTKNQRININQKELDLFNQHLTHAEKISRWRRAAALVAENSAEINQEFHMLGKLDRFC